MRYVAEDGLQFGFNYPVEARIQLEVFLYGMNED